MFYFPWEGGAIPGPDFLRTMIGSWYDVATHRNQIRHLTQGEVQGQVEYRGQITRAWMVFAWWWDDVELPVQEPGKGDGEIWTANKKSLAAQFHPDAFGALGMEESTGECPGIGYYLLSFSYRLPCLTWADNCPTLPVRFEELKAPLENGWWGLSCIVS